MAEKNWKERVRALPKGMKRAFCVEAVFLVVLMIVLAGFGVHAIMDRKTVLTIAHSETTQKTIRSAIRDEEDPYAFSKGSVIKSYTIVDSKCWKDSGDKAVMHLNVNGDSETSVDVSVDAQKGKEGKLAQGVMNDSPGFSKLVQTDRDHFQNNSDSKGSVDKKSALRLNVRATCVICMAHPAGVTWQKGAYHV